MRHDHLKTGQPCLSDEPSTTVSQPTLFHTFVDRKSNYRVRGRFIFVDAICILVQEFRTVGPRIVMVGRNLKMTPLAGGSVYQGECKYSECMVP